MITQENQNTRKVGVGGSDGGVANKYMESW